ncbi:MAG: hypothetical protein Q8O67_00220 [Deltaproteobacteria bacterium]|nr:hypothetical protein [Deltaproteobacteria bacterium]
MTTHELTWSAFLREPTLVEPLLAKGDVLLKRRDAEPLRLTRASGDEATRDALSTAARLLAPAAGDERANVEEHLDARLPWTRFLPQEDRKLFAKEFVREFEACADLGDFTSLGRMLADWKNTASLHAEGLAEILTRPVPKVGGRVSRPRK